MASGPRTNGLGSPQVSLVSLSPLPFAGLPSSPQGTLAWITDSNTAVWGATAAGGGSNKVLVVFNGSAWTVVGK